MVTVFSIVFKSLRIIKTQEGTPTPPRSPAGFVQRLLAQVAPNALDNTLDFTRLLFKLSIKGRESGFLGCGAMSCVFS